MILDHILCVAAKRNMLLKAEEIFSESIVGLRLQTHVFTIIHSLPSGIMNVANGLALCLLRYIVKKKKKKVCAEADILLWGCCKIAWVFHGLRSVCMLVWLKLSRQQLIDSMISFLKKNPQKQKKRKKKWLAFLSFTRSVK